MYNKLKDDEYEKDKIYFRFVVRGYRLKFL